MESQNRGYALSLINCDTHKKEEKIYLKPMALYIPDTAVHAVTELINKLPAVNNNEAGFLLTVTNKNNGVSVDKNFATLDELKDPTIAADAVKELINIVRGYESDEETNVCGW